MCMLGYPSMGLHTDGGDGRGQPGAQKPFAITQLGQLTTALLSNNRYLGANTHLLLEVVVVSAPQVRQDPQHVLHVLQLALLSTHRQNTPQARSMGISMLIARGQIP